MSRRIGRQEARPGGRVGLAPCLVGDAVCGVGGVVSGAVRGLGSSFGGGVLIQSRMPSLAGVVAGLVGGRVRRDGLFVAGFCLVCTLKGEGLLSGATGVSIVGIGYLPVFSGFQPILLGVLFVGLGLIVGGFGGL